MVTATQQTIDHKQYAKKLGKTARAASRLISKTDTGVKNRALMAMAEAVESAKERILAANQDDISASERSGLSSALLDRLELSAERVQGMADGLRQVANLADPVGEITDLCYRPSGIQVGRMRVPLGVIAIIYESRPGVTADTAALCLKSGNAVILRGGSEAIHSNLAIAACIQQGLSKAQLPLECVQVVEIADRAIVGELISMAEYIDVIVPRGGKGLIERISRESVIPVIKHLDGVCHVYIDDRADIDKAVRVADNAKTRRYGICGAMETLLVHHAIATTALAPLVQRYKEKGVELRGCERTRALFPTMATASEEDWHTEYLAPILSIRIVDDMDAAIEHIEHYGSHHTDSIMTEDLTRARRFLREVDSSSVMVNTSTQFADGFEYGLGAEIGISTDKLHARGPVGLQGLTSQKFIVLGDGHTRPS